MLSDLKFRQAGAAAGGRPLHHRLVVHDTAPVEPGDPVPGPGSGQTRLAYYSSSKKARDILGQPRSTIDLRQTIREGGVLLVSTAQDAVGRDVSALVGASLLNLVDSVIREQGSLPPEQRRGALVVVDEMQSMLSELGKFGASFILATQSLAKLDDPSPTMRDTVLANVGCLAVFQMSTTEAKLLVGELDKARVDEEDLVSSAAFHCYIRAIVDGERRPTYSMRVRNPEEGEPQRVRDLAWNYTTPADDLASLHAEAEQRAREFKEKLEQEGEDDETPPHPGHQPAKPKPRPSPNGPAGEAQPGRKGRSRRKEGTTPEQAPAGGGDE